MRWVSTVLLVLAFAVAPLTVGHADPMIGSNPQSASPVHLAHHALPTADFDLDKSDHQYCCVATAGYCMASFAMPVILVNEVAPDPAVKLPSPRDQVLRTADLKVEVPPPRI